MIFIYSDLFVVMFMSFNIFKKTLQTYRTTGPTVIAGLRSFVLRFNVPVNNFLAASNKLSPFDYGSPAILLNFFLVD